ncbi:hypothetical protein [Nonomuraea sp. NPDC050783]|uniref:hypothetical protein n=1 Tax=Nonomuraea sp. NPDC050783 TaxID=3154634 RepID=UPI0034653D35
MRRIAALLGLALLAGCGQAEQPYAPGAAATAPRPVPASSPAPGTDPAEDAPDGSTPDGGTPGERPSDGAPPSGPQTIAIADGLKVRVEWPSHPDPLLRVMVDQYVGTRRAIVRGEPGYRHNLEIDAEAQATKWIRAFIDDQESIRGTGRLYHLRVSARMGKGAQLDACVDESRVQVVSAKSGKAVSPQPRWLRTPYGQSLVAHRGPDGVWRIRTYLTSTERCSP